MIIQKSKEKDFLHVEFTIEAHTLLDQQQIATHLQAYILWRENEDNSNVHEDFVIYWGCPFKDYPLQDLWKHFTKIQWSMPILCCCFPTPKTSVNKQFINQNEALVQLIQYLPRWLETATRGNLRSGSYLIMMYFIGDAMWVFILSKHYLIPLQPSSQSISSSSSAEASASTFKSCTLKLSDVVPGSNIKEYGWWP